MRIIIYIVLLLPITVQAFPIDTSVGWGMGYSWTQASFNEPVVTDVGLDLVKAPSYSAIKNQDLPWNIYAGFRFHQNYGIELGYMDYGSINFQKNITKSTIAGEAKGSVTKDATISTQGLYISHVLYFKVAKKLQLQAKAGFVFGDNIYSETSSFTTIEGATETTSAEAINTSSRSFAKGQLALSALYEYQKNWHLRLQVNLIEFDHPTDDEEFDQWFTGFSIERKL